MDEQALGQGPLHGLEGGFLDPLLQVGETLRYAHKAISMPELLGECFSQLIGRLGLNRSPEE